MVNFELARIEKMLKLINKKYDVDLKNISNIKIEKFEKEAIITIVDEHNNLQIFTVLRKDFEENYVMGWVD